MAPPPRAGDPLQRGPAARGQRGRQRLAGAARAAQRGAAALRGVSGGAPGARNGKLWTKSKGGRELEGIGEKMRSFLKSILFLLRCVVSLKKYGK